jgi:hypothetical protein
VLGNSNGPVKGTVKTPTAAAETPTAPSGQGHYESQVLAPLYEDLDIRSIL